MEELKLIFKKIRNNIMGVRSADQGTLKNNDLVLTTGTDIFGFNTLNGSVKTLAMDPKKRKTFFDSRPGLLSLLQQEEKNPLLEEGWFDDADNRDKMGEYFINFDALKVYVDEKIRKHVTSVGGVPYQTKNIFIVNNNKESLEDVISDLRLKQNEDAKFICVNQVHATAFYLRNINGRIHCFEADSEPYPYSVHHWLIDSVRATFPDAVIVRNTQILQKDYFSCTTFAIKALMYFVKHGDEVFPHIVGAAKQGGLSYDASNTRYNLREDMLMPALLKMCQLRVSPRGRDVIVSIKANLTLSEYWKKHESVFGKSTYNTAAIEKKYHYLDVVGKALTK